MDTDDPKALILCSDAAWRDRTAALLARCGLACVTAETERGEQGTHADKDVAAVVWRSSTNCLGESVEAAIGRLHQQLPSSRIIALVPAGDICMTRRAFRAGAWDCLEEPVGIAELGDCIAEAFDQHCKRHEDASAFIMAAAECDRNTLPHHSAFLDALANLRSLCRRAGQPLSIMMLDIVRFRRCNEQYSPSFGDRVLTWFASNLKDACRRSDLVARYQGDRFIVALPHSRASEAIELAHRFRRAIQAAPLTVEGRPYEIAVTVGIAESTVGFIETGNQLIQRARVALEQAKRQGGGQTVTWSRLMETEPSRRDLQHLTVDGVSHWVERVRQHLRSTYVESTRALVAAVEAKDPCTRAHSMTVATYAETIGKRMQLPARLLNTLQAAAVLHDVGKIGVPDAILTKTGPLTDEEFTIIKRHPETGLEILGHVSFLTDERPLILHHHERYDGTGYPCGLMGDRIPIGARVLAIADALDAMFSLRSYKRAYDVDQVRSELAAQSGRQFDPNVAAVTLRWLDEAPKDLPLAPAPIDA